MPNTHYLKTKRLHSYFELFKFLLRSCLSPNNSILLQRRNNKSENANSYFRPTLYAFFPHECPKCLKNIISKVIRVIYTNTVKSKNFPHLMLEGIIIFLQSTDILIYSKLIGISSWTKHCSLEPFQNVKNI